MMVNVNKPVIGFCGYAGVGKDTAFIELNKLAPSMLFERVAFADPLKKSLESSINFLRSKGFDVLHIPEMKEKFRDLYVQWSIVAKRFDFKIWQKESEPIIRELGRRGRKVTITDVRYVYEITFIRRNLAGLVIYIERPGFGPRNAEEEKSFKEIQLQYPELIENKIINDGTKQELAEKIYKRILSAFSFPETPNRFKCPSCGSDIYQAFVTCNECGQRFCKHCCVYDAPKHLFTCKKCKGI